MNSIPWCIRFAGLVRPFREQDVNLAVLIVKVIFSEGYLPLRGFTPTLSNNYKMLNDCERGLLDEMS